MGAAHLETRVIQQRVANVLENQATKLARLLGASAGAMRDKFNAEIRMCERVWHLSSPGTGLSGGLRLKETASTLARRRAARTVDMWVRVRKAGSTEATSTDYGDDRSGTRNHAHVTSRLP